MSFHPIWRVGRHLWWWRFFHGPGPGAMLWCTRRSPVLPAGAISAPARAKPTHRAPSLGRMEATPGAQRRQGDTRAVTPVKPNEPRDQRPDADTREHVEGHEQAADDGAGGWRFRRGLRARHAWRRRGRRRGERRGHPHAGRERLLAIPGAHVRLADTSPPRAPVRSAAAPLNAAQRMCPRLGAQARRTHARTGHTP
jgi:hypothetical protein